MHGVRGLSHTKMRASHRAMLYWPGPERDTDCYLPPRLRTEGRGASSSPRPQRAAAAPRGGASSEAARGLAVPPCAIATRRGAAGDWRAGGAGRGRHVKAQEGPASRPAGRQRERRGPGAAAPCLAAGHAGPRARLECLFRRLRLPGRLPHRCGHLSAGVRPAHHPRRPAHLRRLGRGAGRRRARRRRLSGSELSGVEWSGAGGGGRLGAGGAGGTAVAVAGGAAGPRSCLADLVRPAARRAARCRLPAVVPGSGRRGAAEPRCRVAMAAVRGAPLTARPTAGDSPGRLPGKRERPCSGYLCTGVPVSFAVLPLKLIFPSLPLGYGWVRYDQRWGWLHRNSLLWP